MTMFAPQAPLMSLSMTPALLEHIREVHTDVDDLREIAGAAQSLAIRSSAERCSTVTPVSVNVRVTVPEV